VPAKFAAELRGAHNLMSMRVCKAGLGLRIGEMLIRTPRTPMSCQRARSASLAFVSSRCTTPRRIAGRAHHGVQHARIVETVCAGLHEHEALKAEGRARPQGTRERCMGRLVAQVGADVGILSARPENMEMGDAGVARRRVCGLKTVIGCGCMAGIVASCFLMGGLPALRTGGRMGRRPKS